MNTDFVGGHELVEHINALQEQLTAAQQARKAVRNSALYCRKQPPKAPRRLQRASAMPLPATHSLPARIISRSVAQCR